MKKLILALTVAALAACVLIGCDFLIGPDEPAGRDGNLVISFGERIDNPASRAITSVQDLPADVFAALLYRVVLTGPGEVPQQTVGHGETLELTVPLGVWKLEVRAYKEDGLAGTASFSIMVMPGLNSVDVPMVFNEGYFSIVPDPAIANGMVQSDPETAFPEATIVLTVTPDEGYVLKTGSLTVNGGDVPVEGEGVSYTFAMPAADVTVGAEFELLLHTGAYAVTVEPTSGGTVRADAISANEGDLVTLTVTPDEGYVLKTGSLTVNGGAVPVEGEGVSYTFVMPAADVTVSAEFNRLQNIGIVVPGDEMVTITAEHNVTGPVQGNAPLQISWAANETLTFAIDSGDYRAENGTLRWMMNESTLASSGTSLVIKARDHLARTYTLTAMIQKNAQWYSTDISFTVVE
jgi:hypothetical protein